MLVCDFIINSNYKLRKNLVTNNFSLLLDGVECTLPSEVAILYAQRILSNFSVKYPKYGELMQKEFNEFTL